MTRAITACHKIQYRPTLVHTYLSPSPLQAGYIAHEEEVGIAVLGRPYIVDLVAMRQVRLCGVLVTLRSGTWFDYKINVQTILP